MEKAAPRPLEITIHRLREEALYTKNDAEKFREELYEVFADNPEAVRHIESVKVFWSPRKMEARIRSGSGRWWFADKWEDARLPTRQGLFANRINGAWTRDDYVPPNKYAPK